jgi:putative redox protein
MPTHKSVRLEHRGGMQFVATPSSGHVMAFDDRVSNQGASPVETTLAALAACSAMDVISIVGKKRQAVESYEVEATGDQRDEYPQVFTEIEVLHVVRGTGLSEAAIRRAIELSASKYCPVSAMISAGATIINHRYRISSSGERPFEAAGLVITTGPYRRPDVIA